MKLNNKLIQIKHQGKENRPYNLDDYNKVISLRKKGFSYRKISQQVNISTTTGQLWVKTSRKPRCLYAMKQQKVLNNKSRKLTPCLAYIYGVLIGDGHLEKSKLSNRITLKVIDKEFALKFCKVLKEWSGFNPTWSEAYRIFNHKTKYGSLINCKSYFYTVRLGSKQAVDFISKNIKCKTVDWDVPENIMQTDDKDIIFAFLKGVFDSEGSAVYSQKYNKKRIELKMYGENVKHLQYLLKKVGIESTVSQGKILKERNMYLLRILRKNSIKVFVKNIGFIIERKKDILSKILNSYSV